MSGRQASSSAWRPLPGVEVPGIPGLLVSADFTPQSYTIHLTDLANLWTESLDKKPIIMRGLKEDTSIDPTDGPDQIRKLLDFVQAAFDPSAPKHRDTTLALSKANGGESDDLEIHVTVVLPKPLRPLKWPIYLRKQPQSAIATELMLPLVHSHQARAREVDELIAALREKDGVITKLVDKLEATGTGLEHVFTALSGRRKVTRATAEERIRGLAPFSESDFRKKRAEKTADREEGGSGGGSAGDDVAALLEGVFGAGAGLPSGSALDIGDSPALNDWWTKLGQGKSAALVSRGRGAGSASSSKGGSQPASAPAAATKPAADDDETQSEGNEDDDFQVQASPPSRKTGSNKQPAEAREDDQDDDFEVQATPPSRKRAPHGRASRVLSDDDGTSDEGEAEIPDSLPSAAARPTSSTKATGKRLGAIGDKTKQPPAKRKTPSPPPTPSPPRTRTRAHPAPASADADSATASEPDANDVDAKDTSPPAPPALPKPSSQPARRAGGGGIGRIGGRRPPAKEATPEAHGSSPPAASQQTTPRRRLGVIGKTAPPDSGGRGRGQTSTRTPVDEGGEEGDVKEEEDEEEVKRETSVERADRMRAELKRELDRKALAAPARKKRKF